MQLVYGKYKKLYYDSKVSTTRPTECRSCLLGLLSILYRNFTLKSSCKVDGLKYSTPTVTYQYITLLSDATVNVLNNRYKNISITLYNPKNYSPEQRIGTNLF